MEQEQWSPDYRQSVTTGLERTADNSNIKIIGTDTELHDSHIKEDPDAKTAFPVIKDEYSPGNVVISEKSRQTIQLILAQIKSLSQNDKYLLYLKLPSEVTDIIDPFRQPLNPLGSRSEISRTIVWIQTHLEEDQNISLPKKEVYNEYEQYCETNNIKPLSQADFGKVMKQVFPKVRARRLGQRGNSKYCYSGLRRRVDLKAPSLPDLYDKPLSTEAPVCQTSVTYAAWLIVKDWAQQQLGVQFSSLQALADYLVRKCSVGSGSDAACKLTSSVDAPSKGDDTASKNFNKHREMQLQLQKKIQQRSEGKERKRKFQAVKPEPKPGTKKSRSHSVPASTIASTLSQDLGLLGGGLTSSECSTASSSCGSNSVSPTQGRIICDKPEFTQPTALPDFKSFQKAVVLSDSGPAITEVVGQEKASPTVTAGSSSKIAVPRLQQTSPKGSVPGQAKPQQQQQQRKAKYKSIQPRLQPCDIPTYNAQAQPVTTQVVKAALADTRSHQLVQNVPEDNVNEISGNNRVVLHSILDKTTDSKCADALNECEDDEDFPLTRERLDSVSNVEKDAMDEYLGTNHSQHDEELSKYFSANGEPEIAPPPSDLDSNSTKLSTLRQLLEQNGISEKRPATIPNAHVTTLDSSNITPIPDPAPFPSLPPFVHTLHALPTLPSLSNSSARRRVSFETPPEDSVPPSPNTRSKNFSFTPISPGPHSPNGVQSKCSSTTASPFVSPRNTPVPRTKNATHQNAGIIMHAAGKQLVNNVKKELVDLSLEIPAAEAQLCIKSYLPMSAPVSPLLTNSNNSVNTNNNNNNHHHSKSMLQKLLNANSKVQYTPEYASPQAVDSNHQFFPDLSSRSHSVPLSAGFPPLNNSSQIITEIMKRDPELHQGSENVKRLFGSLGNQQQRQQPCDNNNIDAFNLDMSSSNHCLTEYGLNLINTCSEPDFGPYTQTQQKLRNVTRSQSIDVVDVDFDVNKCNPSRSVPSTPLPFTQNLKISVIDNKRFQTSSRSYPSTPLNANETFVYQVNSDCLLNGQPIRTDSTENIDFMPNFEINSETTNVSQLDSNDFGIIENGDDLIDESDILLQQGYNSNIN